MDDTIWGWFFGGKLLLEGTVINPTLDLCCFCDFSSQVVPVSYMMASWAFKVPGPLLCGFFVPAYPLQTAFFIICSSQMHWALRTVFLMHELFERKTSKTAWCKPQHFYHPPALLSLLQLGRSQLMIVNPGFIWNGLSGQNLRDETLWIRLSFKNKKGPSAPFECLEAVYHNGTLEDFKDLKFIQKKQNLSSR